MKDVQDAAVAAAYSAFAGGGTVAMVWADQTFRVCQTHGHPPVQLADGVLLAEAMPLFVGFEEDLEAIRSGALPRSRSRTFHWSWMGNRRRVSISACAGVPSWPIILF